jgi:hypothetical protein
MALVLTISNAATAPIPLIARINAPPSKGVRKTPQRKKGGMTSTSGALPLRNLNYKAITELMARVTERRVKRMRDLWLPSPFLRHGASLLTQKTLITRPLQTRLLRCNPKSAPESYPITVWVFDKPFLPCRPPH